jgi:hypothetical protein
VNATEPKIEIVTSGAVSAGDAEHAGAAIRDVLAAAAGPVPSATVTLSVLPDSGLPRPSVAQATVEQGLRRVRVQAAASNPREAVELLRRRLAVRMDYLQAS